MANRGYDAVVDVDEEVCELSTIPDSQFVQSVLTNTRHSQGDLGHTDLHEDLEFHSSSMS